MVKKLKITGVMLGFCNIFDSNYQQNSRALDAFIPTNLFSLIRYFTQKFYLFIFLTQIFYIIEDRR